MMIQTANLAWKDFLAAPVPAHSKDHIVQFYESESFLATAVSHYIESGLKLGEGVVIIATRKHESLIREDLALRGWAVDSSLASGQLLFLEAEATLERFMAKGLPDRSRFRDLFGRLIQTLSAQHPRIRAYGEMVDVLRSEGNYLGMIELESCWTELANEHSFSLLCGYLMQGFDSNELAASFKHVCSAHTHVLPTEKFIHLEDERSRNRTIASLQQQAIALKRELGEREKMEAALREAVRVRDEFLSIASHELKTPLTTLKLQTQMYRRRLKMTDAGALSVDESAKMLGATERQTNRLTKLVEDMLDISRISHGKLNLNLQETDLSALVIDSLSRHSEQIEQSGSVLRTVLDPSLVGNWDSQRIEQVIENLLTNATKYGQGTPIEVSVTQVGNEALFTVRDHGLGIARENLDRIFHRFERAVSSKNFGGLGLGLFIAKQIVDAHDGRIWAESVPGQTTFSVSLPLASSPSPAVH